MSWIKVEDDAELKPGMTVKLVDSGCCGGAHVVVLFSRLTRPGVHAGETTPCRAGWRHSGIACTKARGELCLAHSAIPEGRVYGRDVGPLARSSAELAEDIRVALHGLKKAVAR